MVFLTSMQLTNWWAKLTGTEPPRSLVGGTVLHWSDLIIPPEIDKVVREDTSVSNPVSVVVGHTCIESAVFSLPGFQLTFPGKNTREALGLPCGNSPLASSIVPVHGSASCRKIQAGTHEIPNKPTLPLDQGCSAHHSITSAKSLLV